MTLASKRSLQSVMKIIEDASPKELQDFFCQSDKDFAPLSRTTADLLGHLQQQDTTETRDAIFAVVSALEPATSLLVEIESERALLLSEERGPSALKVIAEEQLSSEEYEALFERRGALAAALRAHAVHRRTFDDAVSFRNARVWREGKLYSAFDVDLERPKYINASSISRNRLLAAIRKRLKLNVECGFSAVDLPEIEAYKPSVLVIIRIPKDFAEFAEHMNDGGRRMRLLRPQKEVLLIYTPSDQRIEICADTTVERTRVSECFATEVLEHNVSNKPLTWVNYDLSCFFHRLTLDPLDVPGFLVEEVSVLEIEVRLTRWKQRLRLSASFEDDIEALAQTFLAPAQVMQRASGISRVVIEVRYKRNETDTPAALGITISDRNRCNLLSNRDPELRRLGQTLLSKWKIMHLFKDLEPDELEDFLPLLVELYDSGTENVGATFFAERKVDPDRLTKAKLIVRKGVEEVVVEHENEDLPPIKDRILYAINTEWLEQRIIEALQDILSVHGKQEITSKLFFIGIISIDEKDVPCYLARGLTDKKHFIDADVNLRARAGAGPGIVFTGKELWWKCIATNLIITIPQEIDGAPRFSRLNRSFVETFYRANLALALGTTTLTLVENEDGDAGTLYVPGKAELALLGEHQVRCFRLLVDAKKKGLPGVKTKDLIAESGSTGLQQMLGMKRWPIFEDYLEKFGHGWWAINCAL